MVVGYSVARSIKKLIKYGDPDMLDLSELKYDGIIYRHAKFGDNISNGGRVIAIFRFSKWRPPPSWIWLDFVFRPPTTSTWWPEAMFKILCRSDLYSRRYCDCAISIVSRLIWLKMPLRGSKMFFGRISSSKHFGLSSRPPKGTSLRVTALSDV